MFILLPLPEMSSNSFLAVQILSSPVFLWSIYRGNHLFSPIASTSNWNKKLAFSQLQWIKPFQTSRKYSLKNHPPKKNPKEQKNSLFTLSSFLALSYLFGSLSYMLQHSSCASLPPPCPAPIICPKHSDTKLKVLLFTTTPGIILRLFKFM